MDKVTVYQFGKYDLATDKVILSKRMATKEAAAHHGFTILENTAQEIDASKVGNEVEGMTDKRKGNGMFSDFSGSNR